MAVTALLYGQFLLGLASKEMNLSADTLKVALLSSAYTPNQDTHRYKSSLAGEISSSGTNYPAGGLTLTNVTLAYDANTNRLKLDADDVSFTPPAGVQVTARYAVIYDATPSTDATRPLIGYVDFGADASATGAPFAIVWDSAGIAGLVAA